MKIAIKDEFIKIGQLLKKIKVISTGGEAKNFLENNDVKINGKKPEGRGSKVHIGDTLWIGDDLYQVVADSDK